MKKNALEWTVFALGCLTILGLVGTLAMEAATTKGVGPALTVKSGTPRERGGAWEVPVTVRNEGDAPASAVAVTGRSGEEEASYDIELLPADSRREGVLRFETRPQAPKILVTGAETP